MVRFSGAVFSWSDTFINDLGEQNTHYNYAVIAKRRGFTSALEAAQESRVIPTNRIWHNLDAVLMGAMWNADVKNPLDGQKEKGLSWPSPCEK